MLALLKKVRRKVLQSQPFISTMGKNPNSLTNTQELFVRWNAERLDIPEQESRDRYYASWSAISGGHGGLGYRSFNDLSYKLFQVLYSDNDDEIYTAYERHSPMHFLRMLSYPEPQWRADDRVVQHLKERPSVDIVDYGCGLAQSSRSLASYLKAEGTTVRLFLADIPTIRKDFLLWLGEQNGIETQFLDCTATTPIPALPDCDICIATEFFEHVYDPSKYFENIHGALRSNGLLVTNVGDHAKEFMHVSPSLAALRSRIQELGYEALEQDRLLRKAP